VENSQILKSDVKWLPTISHERKKKKYSNRINVAKYVTFTVATDKKQLIHRNNAPFIVSVTLGLCIVA
jgi:hypothetical protein